MIGSAGVACARLSLVDFDRGRQPLDSDAGRLVVAVNGGIYNHDALRAELRARHGGVFRGRSDTEVLLLGFECEGTPFLSRLEGMFALAITDGRTLWLARDSFGMKPLFVHRSKKYCLIASEIKAIKASGIYELQPNLSVLSRFLFDGALDESEQTFFEGIEHVPASTAFEIDLRGSMRRWRYWSGWTQR